MKKISLFLLLIILSTASYALSPEQKLPNDLQEERARNLFMQVRCLSCQGQVIGNSDAKFSYEMRQLIRKRISSGKSNEEIKVELVKEYGGDILINPSPRTIPGLILWALPIVFILFFSLLVFKIINS